MVTFQYPVCSPLSAFDVPVLQGSDDLHMKRVSEQGRQLMYRSATQVTHQTDHVLLSNTPKYGEIFIKSYNIT